MAILLCTLSGCSRHELVHLHVATTALRFTTREVLQMLEENSISTDIYLTHPMTTNSQMKTATLQ